MMSKNFFYKSGQGVRTQQLGREYVDQGQKNTPLFGGGGGWKEKQSFSSEINRNPNFWEVIYGGAHPTFWQIPLPHDGAGKHH